MPGQDASFPGYRSKELPDSFSILFKCKYPKLKWSTYMLSPITGNCVLGMIKVNNQVIHLAFGENDECHDGELIVESSSVQVIGKGLSSDLSQMKQYPEINTVVHGLPNVLDINNPYIFGKIDLLVNLSEHELTKAVNEILCHRNVEVLHFPLSEENGADWGPAYVKLLPMIAERIKHGIHVGICCSLGNNRSRTLAEALFYVFFEKHYHDEYKGEYNHLIYNCAQGHLPEIAEFEETLRLINH